VQLRFWFQFPGDVRPGAPPAPAPRRRSWWVQRWVFFLPETRGHLPVPENAAKGPSKGVRAREGERVGEEREEPRGWARRGAVVAAEPGAPMGDRPGRPRRSVHAGPWGVRLPPAPQPPTPLSHRFPLAVLGGAGMYWDPRAWHRHALGPVGLALGYAGSHGSSAGTCWDTPTQHWDVLESTSPALGWTGCTAPALGLNWDPWLLHRGSLGL